MTDSRRRDRPDLIEILSRIDWNFPGASTPERTVHTLHWFPGNFIPQIPAYLVQLLSSPGELVVDPFAGSGTTVVEAAFLGRRAWASDSNLASIQVTRGKVAAITNGGISRQLASLAADLIWEGVLQSERLGARGEGGGQELGSWFDPDTISQLRYIWGLIEGTADADVRAVLEMLFSDTLFACASSSGAVTSSGRRRRHHWGWVADNVRPKRAPRRDAIKLFRDRAIQAADVLKSTPIVPSDAVAVRRQDARALSLDPCSADLVVTSPPYVGMIDYALANRLTYLWHGWDLHADRDAEIGARCRRNTRSAVEAYLAAMRGGVGEIDRVLKPGGYCSIVIGSSRKFPDVVSEVVGLFSEAFDVVWGPEGRTATRRRVSDRQGREPLEWVCIFQKDA